MVTTKQVSRIRYRARKRGLSANLSWSEWCKTDQDFGGKCAYCFSISASTIDHYLPLAQGGASCANNCVPCCYLCNQKKGSSHPKDVLTIPRERMAFIELYLRFRGQKDLISLGELVKAFFSLNINQVEGANNMYFEEALTKKEASPLIEQRFASGECLKVVQDQNQFSFSLSRELGSSSFQLSTVLTLVECVQLATSLFTLALPQVNAQLSPSIPQTDSWKV